MRTGRAVRRPVRRAAEGVRVLGLARRSRAALLLGTALQATAVLVVALPAAAAPPPNAQPTGGQVVAGTATIGQSATQTTINQASQRAAINWTGFDVGSQQTVTFNQPSSSAVTLNRVTSANPSEIAGRIQANGQVVITNQSGVVFTQGAQVDTAGLIVSAAGINTQNFMAGRMVFDEAAKAGAAVINQGTITVRQAGLAALVAPQVANSGTINARLGHVVLAGARAATLDLYGDGLVSIDVTRQVTEAPVGADGKPVTALVTNTGAIVAAGGTVQLTAAAVDGVVTNLVTAGGRISTATRGGRTGTIVVDATGGSASVTGTLAAEGRAAGTSGGAVQVNATGGVTLAAGSKVSVAGKAGGGTVALGTTLARAKGGAAVAAPTAKTLAVQAGATVVADATANGDGGRIVLLSGESTRMDGGLSAKGGAQGGNGGFVEVSGRTLGITGGIDTSARFGATGTILLDPDFLTIVDGTAGSGDQDPTFTGNGGSVLAGDPSIGSDTISNGIINAFSGNVLLQAGKTLTVAGNIALTSHPGQSLTLEAGGSLYVLSGISVTASGDVILATGGAGPSSPPAAQAAPLISILGTVASTGGSVSLLAGVGGTIAIGAAATIAAASGQRLTLQSDTLALAAGGQLQASGGTVEIAPASALAVHLAGSGGLAIAQDVISAVDASVLRIGAVTVGGTLSTTAASITIDGSLTLPNGVATLDVHASGSVAVGSLGGIANLGTLTGASDGFDATSGANVIGTVGSYAATGDFAARVIGSTTLAGPISAANLTLRTVGASAIAITGSVAVTGTVALTGGTITLGGAAILQGSSILLSGATGITLDGNAVLGQAGAVLDLTTASGDVTEAGTASLIGATLRSTSGIGGNASLAGSNTLAALGAISLDGTLVLSDGAALSVAASVSAARIYIQDAAVTIAAAGTLAATGLVSLRTDGLTVASGGTLTASMLELAPVVSGTAINVGQVGGLLASLDGIGATSVRLGAVTLPGSSAPTTLASVVSLAGAFGRADTALELDALNAIGQADGAVLTATTLSVHAGGAVNLGVANAIATLGTVTAGSFGLSDSGQAGTLTIAGPVVAGDIAIYGATAITVAGSVIATDRLFLSAGSGGMTLQGGALLDAGTLDLRSGGGIAEAAGAAILATHLQSGAVVTGTVDLAGTANAIGTLDAFAVTGGSFSLVDKAGTGLVVAGAVAADSIAIATGAQALTVTGSVTATDALGLASTGITLAAGAAVSGGTITLDGASGGIALLAGASLGNSLARIDLTATGGGVTEAAGAIVTAATLLSTAGVSGSVDLAGTANAIGTLAGMTVSGGTFRLLDTGNLAVTGTLAAAGVSVTDTGTLTVSGSILPAGGATAIAVGLTAAALGLSGLVSAGTAGTLSLVATAGAITETGTLIAGTLSGTASGSATLTGAGATINQVATLAGFDAASFTLTDGRDLSVVGTLRGGSAVTITDSGTLQVGGTIAPLGTAAIAVGLTAAALDLPGLVSDGGAGTLSLVATSLDIVQAGTLIAGTLSGSAGGSVSLTGSGTAINQVATLGNFRAGGGLSLDDGRSLLVAGTLQAGTTISLRDSGTLQVTGTIAPIGTAAIAVGLTADALVLSGLVSDGGAGTLSLVATGGAIDQSGTLIAGTLSGSATGAANLTGAGAAIDQVATLGSFSATAFTLRDGRDLTVAGSVRGTTAVTIVDAGSLLVAGTIAPSGSTAITVGLTASALDLPGLVSDGGSGTVSLVATGGGIDQSGTLIAGTLSGSATGAASLTGAGVAIDQVATLGNFSAGGGFALNDGSSLLLAGTVQAGSSVTLRDAGTLLVSGTIAPTGAGTAIAVGLTADAITLPGLVSDGGAGSVALVANTGAIDQGGTLVAGTLTGSAAGAVTLLGATSTANQVARLGDVQAASFSLNDGRSLTLAGTLATSQAVTILDSGTLAITGAVRPIGTGTIAVGLTADAIVIPGSLSDGGTGSVALVATTGGITETGTLIAGTLSGQAAATVDLSGAGAAINQVATLADFAAGSLTLRDGHALTIAGSVRVGSALQILDSGTLLVDGSVGPSSGVAIAVGLTADAIGIAGSLSDGGAGTVALVARSGALTETGTLQAGTLSGSATGGISLAGAQPTANSVAALGPMSAGSDLALNTAGTLDVVGAVSAGAGRTITLRADGLALDATVTAAGGQVSIAPATVGRVISLDATRRSGTLSLQQSDFDAIRTGTLTLGSTDGATPLAGAIQVNGTAMVGSATATLLRLYASGAIDGSGVLGATQLTGSAGSVALSGANAILQLGDFSAPNGFSLANATDLLVSGTVLGGPQIAVTDRGTLTLSGSLVASAVSLTGAALALNGGIAATVSVALTANQGSIVDTGTITTALLTGSAATTASLTGANAVAALGDFTAVGGLTLNDATDLLVSGSVGGGTQATLIGTGSISVTGSLGAGTVAIDAAAIALSGAITGTSAVTLTSAGAIGGSGILTTALLSGSAGGAVALTGANRIDRLGDFTAGAGFSLVDQADLVIAGTLAGGPSVAIVDAGTLSVPGVVTADTIALTAQAIDLTGQVTAGDSLALVATTGAIGASGTIVTPLLTGSAATGASLTGPNRIATLGDFTATAGLVLNDLPDLTVSGNVDGGSFVTLTDAGVLSIPGRLAGRSATLAAAVIAVSGSLTGSDRLSLTATQGGIGGSGTVGTARLTGSAAGSVALSGPNQVTGLFDFTAGTGFTLNNRPDLAIGGVVDGGSSVVVTNAGSIAVTGTVASSNVLSLTSTAGSISETDATLQARSLHLTAVGRTITLDGGTLLTGGTTPSGAVALTSGLLPSNGGAGALLTAGSVRQTGTLTIANPAGGDAVAELLVAGNVSLATVAAPDGWLVLNLRNGVATGTDLTLRRLDVYYVDGGSAALNGTIRGLSGVLAAQNAFILPKSNARYLFNGCAVGSVNCVVIQRDPVPAQKPLDTIDFAPGRSPGDDPDLFQILPNVSKRDY